MRISLISRKTLGLLAVVIPLVALFIYVALKSGPLAPVAVTVQSVSRQAVTPVISGLGTVQARYRYGIGPTASGRVLQVEAQVGDSVKAGQVLAVMDPVDLNDRLAAQQAALGASEARLAQAQARERYARTQSERYRKLLAAQGTSQEIFLTKQQEWTSAKAEEQAAHNEVRQSRSNLTALQTQMQHLTLKAPVDALVVARLSEPGSAVGAGQALVELVDTRSIWIDARFEQTQAAGLTAGLPVTVHLRSQASRAIHGQVHRVEPLADTVTEETLAKIVFDTPLASLPPLGELAEVEVQLAAVPDALAIPNAALHEHQGQSGVWLYRAGKLAFRPLVLGVRGIDGWVQVKEGLQEGDQVVVYSESALSANTRVLVRAHLNGQSS